MAGNSIDIIINAITSGFNTNMNRLSSTVSSSIGGLEKLSKTVIGLGAAYAGFTGLKSFAEDIIKTRMEYEKMEAALSATVGAEDAGKVFKSLQQFAKDTPFTLEQVTTSYQRLVNLGLNPSKEAMLAYGNIAAGIPNKSITDFIEAVADAVTGENERLKEFGIKASKNGDMVSYTFQGVTKTIKATKENIEAYLTSVGKSFANGKALENQAATMSGRLAALGDTYDQLKNNIAKSSGAASVFGDTIGKVTDFVSYLNDLFESDAISSYVDAFKTSFQPLVDLFNTLKTLAEGTPFAQYFQNGPEQIAGTWEQLKGLYNEFMDFVAVVDEMFKNGTMTEIWNEAQVAVQPFIDMLHDFSDWLSNSFTEAWTGLVADIKSIWDVMPNVIKEPVDNAIDYIKSLFTGDDGSVNGANLVDKIRANFAKFPAYIRKNIYDAIAEFKYFRDVAIAYVNAVVVAVKEFSASAGNDLLNGSLAKASDVYQSKIKENADAYQKTSEQIDVANKKVAEGFAKAQKSADDKRKAQQAQIVADKKQADDRLTALKKEQEANKNKDDAGDVGKKVLAKQQAAAKASGGSTSGPPKAAKKGRGGSSDSKENSEYKKLLDQQIKLEEDRFKQGEVSAKEHYDKLLELKLAQLGKENTATSSAYKKNLEIINNSASTEDQKKKAIEANQKLQTQMNGSTEEEKNIRQEIANQLRDANKEFQKNIQDIQSALNDLQDNSTVDDKMKDFESKYGEMRKRIKAEDEANGTNFLPKLDQLQALTKATADIAEQQRQLNVLEAEYDANVAEVNAKVASGAISSSEGKKQEIALTKELSDERVKYLQNELNIANQTQGFSSIQSANIRKQLAEYQKAQSEISSTMKDLTSGISSAFDSLFDSVIDGTKSFSDTLKDFLSDISKSVVNVLTKGWAEQLVGAFGFGGSSSGANASTGSSAGGLFSSLGSLIGGMFATGGVMKPNTYNVVGENGPELVYNGSRPTSVMNNGSYNRLNSGSGSTVVNMNITTKDANSMRQSSKQMMVQMQQEANRQINRNT